LFDNFLKKYYKKVKKMGKKILNGFKGLSIYDKLRKFEYDLIEINLLIESIENEKIEEKDAAGFVRRFIDIKKLKKIEERINRFLKFPLMEPGLGRPVEYPDSEQEKKKYNLYRIEGLSIRQIAKKEKTSPDTVLRKLKKYNIK
jgi:phage pi2 protein 07